MSAPPASPATPSIKDRVQSVINFLRPVIQSDGGDIELVDVSPDGRVQVRLLGACIGCPSSAVTLQQGVERNIREKVPEVREVVAIAD